MRRVVITGVGCVTPIGNDVDTFWSNLCAGKHGFAPITKFDTGKMKATLAAEVKGFDAEQYIPKNEARRMDLFSQYAIAAATQAVEDSKILGTIDSKRLGVYIGAGVGGTSTIITETTKALARGVERVSPFLIPMMIINTAGALVAIRFHAHGPSLPIVTACATGTHEVGEAFHAIRDGYAEAIITGGSEAGITTLGIGCFANCQALSTSSDPDRCSIPFDKERNGFVMGEGAGVLILEEYEHAVQRGAHIYCEVIGYGNTCDAYHITAPEPEALMSTEMITRAYEDAKTTPSEKLYINAHGTSTIMNDRTETLAIKQALGDLAYKIPVSSTKSMTGHMMGATGAVEAIILAKAIEEGTVPGTIGYREPDPDCDLDYVIDGTRHVDIDQAMSTSLGFGGHNACLLVKKL